LISKQSRSSMLKLSTPTKVFLALCLLAALVGLAILFQIEWRTVPALVQEIPPRVRETGPWLYFTALALLPAFGFPLSPLLVMAASFGLAIALPGIAVALAVNLTLTYGAARFGLRGLVTRLLTRREWKMPEVTKTADWRIILLVRTTPGMPFFAQNYLLGVAAVPFLAYFAISWSVNVLLAVAILVAGESALSGRGALALSALTAAVFLALLLRLVGRELKKKLLPPAEPTPRILSASEAD
jgi:uncharacterized membrane protein YdjX (TVP38/TMEM64 family)